jgi:hypothetical protein
MSRDTGTEGQHRPGSAGRASQNTQKEALSLGVQDTRHIKTGRNKATQAPSGLPAFSNDWGA